MNPNLVAAAMLVVIWIAGNLALRRFPRAVRFAFDALCFVAISLYLAGRGIFPVFPPLSGDSGTAALSLRAIGGAWWLLGARLLVTAVTFALDHNRRSRGAQLSSDLFAAVTYIATIAIVLNSVFALPVTGIVATSGVVAIVIGLALQNTLADVFAGIAVGVEAPFGVGDRIQVGEKIEGQVIQINWRSIRVQTDGDDVAIIPNSVVAKSEIVNRSFPNPRRNASVEISCPGAEDPECVIEALLQATMLCPDILATPPPQAGVARIGPSRILYAISFAVESSSKLAPTKDLLLRFARRQLLYAPLLQAPSIREGGGAPPAPLIRRLLRSLIVFESLDEARTDALLGSLEPRRLEAGATLFLQDAADSAIYIVASGVLQLIRYRETFTETLGYIGAGEYIGEIGLLTGAPHAASATARTACLVYKLPREAVAPLLSGDAALASAFQASARRGLERLNREVAVRATPSVEGELLARIRSVFHLGVA